MRTLSVAVALVALSTHSAIAQWTLGVEIGVAHYHGTAHDTSNGGGPPTLRPGDATSVGVRVGREIGRWGVALRATYGTPGFAAAGPDLTITDRSMGSLIEVAPVFAIRLARVGPNGSARAEAGPAFHVWKLGDEIRSRVGGLGAFAYEWPVASRWSGAFRVEGTISPSWFNDGDVPPEYERRPTWRYGVTLGLRYRL